MDTTVFKNNHNSLSTKLFTKPTDRTAYLHSKSYHPKSLINNIPYGQALRAKRICSEEEDLVEALDNMKAKFISRGYFSNVLDNHFKEVLEKDRRSLLQYTTPSTKTRLQFAAVYNKNLPDIKSAIHSNWETLRINSKLANIFEEKPIIAFKRNKNLKELLGGTHIANNKRVTPKKLTTGKCSPCLSKRGNLCCKQLVSTDHFRSETTGEKFYIKHHVNCHTTLGNYLGFCILCPKKQYIGKFETKFNSRMNNHRTDAKKQSSIPFDEHFNQPNHDFTQHARFIIIEKLKDTGNKDDNRRILKEREDYWIDRIKTYQPYGLNLQYNSPIRNKTLHICT